MDNQYESINARLRKVELRFEEMRDSYWDISEENQKTQLYVIGTGLALAALMVGSVMVVLL